jgi:hypothetical protein
METFMSGNALDQAVANSVPVVVEIPEVTLAAVLPIVVESAESSELTKVEVTQDTSETEVSIETLLGIMSEVPKND